MEDILKNAKDCMPKNKYRAIELNSSMITDTTCTKQGCGLFNIDCKQCKWNTKTPVIYVYGKRYIIDNPDNTVVVVNNKNVTLLTRKEFDKRFEYTKI